jgi:pimeloyl-ACP methyl ester carboxylesterase
MSSTEKQWHLEWRTTSVQGRPAVYAVAGDGPRLVFLHGWGLNHRTYRRALKGLVRKGMRVYAPALPGFGGTAALPRGEFSLAGYAQWVVAFLDAVGIDQAVTLVGHSFGGGVTIQTAHDAPARVSRLVLINSIGGSAWTSKRGVARSMRDRPLWDWGLHLPADTFSPRQFTRVLPVIAADALPNLARRPLSLWRVGQLARTADLTPELTELRRRKVPVVILWGRDDKVIPTACLDSLKVALGEPTVYTVDGSHSWLIAHPDRFAEVMTNIVGLEAPQDAA